MDIDFIHIVLDPFQDLSVDQTLVFIQLLVIELLHDLIFGNYHFLVRNLLWHNQLFFDLLYNIGIFTDSIGNADHSNDQA